MHGPQTDFRTIIVRDLRDRLVLSHCYCANPRLGIAPARVSSEADLGDRASRAFRQPHRAALDFDFHLLEVQTEPIEDGCLKIANVMAMFDGVIADFVGAAVRHTAANPAARQPAREPSRIMTLWPHRRA